MFENYHGEHCARLAVDQSIHPPRTNRNVSWLHWIFLSFMFWIPQQCMTKLESMRVDDILCKTRWMDFLSDRRKEWEKNTTPVSFHTRLILQWYTHSNAGNGTLIG